MTHPPANKRRPSTLNMSTRRNPAPSSPAGSDTSSMSSVELSPPPDTPTTPAIVRSAARQQQQQAGAGRAGERLQALLGAEGVAMEVNPMAVVPPLEATVPLPTATPALGGKATSLSKGTTERISRSIVDASSSSSESSSSDEDEPTDIPLFDDAVSNAKSSAPPKIRVNAKQPVLIELPAIVDPAEEQPLRVVYTYPPSCVPLKHLSETTQQIKLARFLKCRTEGCACDGLKPPGYTTGIEHNNAEGSKNEASRIVLWTNPSYTPHLEGIEHLDPLAREITQETLWDHCGACGCGWSQGGPNVDTGRGHTIPTAVEGGEGVDKDELQRRRRVAHRAEEMMEVCLFVQVEVKG